MAMSNESVARNHVVPRLTTRQAPSFTLPATIAVRKATRDFDELVHEVGAIGSGKSYELPKKAAKTGITDVDLTLSDNNVKSLFPDLNRRTFHTWRACFYDTVRRPLLIMTAFMLARAYYLHYHKPTPFKTFADIIWHFLPIAFWWVVTGLSFVGSVVLMWILAFWKMLQRMDQVFQNFNDFITGEYTTIAADLMRFKTWYAMFTEHYARTRDGLCMFYRHEWICPPAPQPVWWRAVKWIAVKCWELAPLLGQPLFWQSVVIFLLCCFIAERLTRRKTIWTVRLRIESQVFSIARCQKTRAKQETTGDKVAATPILTHVENHIREAHKNMPVEVRDKYLVVCLLVAAGWAYNRVTIIQTTEGEPDTEPVPENSRESLGDLGVAKRLLKTRNNTAPLNMLRKSVLILKKTWAKLFDDVQRGQDRVMPEQDVIKEYYSGVVTGPELFDITEGFEGNVDDEIAGVSRHLRQLKSTLRDEYLPQQLTPAAEERLNHATLIIKEIVKRIAEQNSTAILEWGLPKKWGNARETYHQRLVEVAGTTFRPFLSGFCKLAELALPLNKLPRLVGSMGMLSCAKDAAALCSVEQLFKQFLPHLVVKGMTQDGIAARFSSFADRAKRLGLRILSIDMSAMDSSWTPGDRSRVRSIQLAVVDVVRHMLEAELQEDYVTQCSGKQRRLRWVLKYIEVELAAEDSILFSGERGTSIGNRILMLIVWSAELLRVYGEEDGKQRIEKMFHCPDYAHKTTTDDKAVGRVEQPPVKDVFPESALYDNNIGDGDDCTLAIPKDMYASEEEFIVAYEAYYKLVEPCSAWAEYVDLECLSLMCVSSRGSRFFVPKVARNIQRLIAHKIRIPPGSRFAEGQPTYVPTAHDYAQIATDLWQRSFSLKNSMVSRHLCRAMFEYCYGKAGDARTVYDEDLHRLGKEDGDMSLADCLEEVRENASCDVSAYVMIKATNFKKMNDLSGHDIARLKSEWFHADLAWSALELTDDLCAHPDVLLTNFPVSPGVAKGLGFRQELVDLMKHQLVKEEGVLPEMSTGMRPGGREEDTSDGAEGDLPHDIPPLESTEEPVLHPFDTGARTEKVYVRTESVARLERHTHKCWSCGQVYEHGHPGGQKRHDQCDGSCPNLMCANNKPGEDHTGAEIVNSTWPAKFAFEMQTGKLEDLPSHFSLAHCVSADFKMSAGIATMFKERFGCVDQLLSMKKTVGDVAWLKVAREDEGTPTAFRYVYYMITKELCMHKPTHTQFYLALGALKKWVMRHEVRYLGIPLIGCGLDKLSWSQVQNDIVKLFSDVSVRIVVRVLPGTNPAILAATPSAPGSSANRQPVFEVKAPVAEAGESGPSQPDPNLHAHVCPMCGTEYSHSHPFQRVEHKQHKGACPNKECSYHVGAKKGAEDVLTSSERAEVRQSRVSSPLDGCGTVQLGKRDGKGTGSKTGDKGLSHPAAVSYNAGKSHAGKAESKGKGKGKQSKGKLPKVCDPGTQTQTAVPAMTSVQAAPSAPRIVVGTSSASDRAAGDAPAAPKAASAATQAGSSGRQRPKDGDSVGGGRRPVPTSAPLSYSP